MTEGLRLLSEHTRDLDNKTESFLNKPDDNEINKSQRTEADKPLEPNIWFLTAFTLTLGISSA